MCNVLKRIILSCCISASCLLAAYPQDIRQIKSDPRYYWAEGRGITVNEADGNAMSQIARQISVSISTQLQTSDRSVSDESGIVSANYSQEGFVKSFSSVSLQNVGMMVLSPEPEAVVFRYVTKSDVEKMFEERRQKIVEYVETGKVNERELQIDNALRNYYWALMLAQVCPEAVYAEFDGEQRNCLVFLPSKIASVISHIKANLEECEYSADRYRARLNFSYNDRPVASVQLKYFDGQSIVGPVVVRDGIGELDMVSLPFDKKVKIWYEYKFENEARNFDNSELRAAFDGASAPMINSAVEMPVKVNEKKGTMQIEKKYRDEGVSVAATEAVAEIPVEPTDEHKRLEIEEIPNAADYLPTLQKVEAAIKAGRAQDAYECFTPYGYALFDTLMNKTGARVSLISGRQDYELLRGNGGQVLARFCRIKFKYPGGPSFTEKLVFRFDEHSKKIQSIAFALTDKAEEDIFKAAAKWPEVSRFIILQFMEDYQTAYFLKRLGYLEQIFSDDAIIITGTVLKKASSKPIDGVLLNLDSIGNGDVKYTRHTKKEYIDRMHRHFRDRTYIHLTFENNTTEVVNAPRLPAGTAFVIQIRQLYTSPVYSDRGYLTLMLDTSGELPIIYVRFWEPEMKDLTPIETFHKIWEI